MGDREQSGWNLGWSARCLKLSLGFVLGEVWMERGGRVCLVAIVSCPACLERCRFGFRVELRRDFLGGFGDQGFFGVPMSLEAGARNHPRPKFNTLTLPNPSTLTPQP